MYYHDTLLKLLCCVNQSKLDLLWFCGVDVLGWLSLSICTVGSSSLFYDMFCHIVATWCRHWPRLHHSGKPEQGCTLWLSGIKLLFNTHRFAILSLNSYWSIEGSQKHSSKTLECFCYCSNSYRNYFNYSKYNLGLILMQEGQKKLRYVASTNKTFLFFTYFIW